MMSALLTTVVDWVGMSSWLEITAVVSAIGYLLLVIRQNIWCWACAGISTALYVYIFIDARLYMESALNGFYFAMAIYGWSVWSSGRTLENELPVSTWSVSRHAAAVFVIITISGASGLLLDRHTNAAFPYVDSLTTWSAIWATFLVAQKVLENWWYWLIIDVASIFIYFARGLEMTAILFLVYVLLIPLGFLSWHRSWREYAR